MKQAESQRTTRIIKALTVYPNFPKPGVKFLDIFSLLSHPDLFNDVLDIFSQHLKTRNWQKIFMLETRGFLFGVPLGLRFNRPSYPLRKKGKLPGQVITQNYSLEYGHDQIEIQKSAIKEGDRVVIVDDVVATGGTLNAAIKLIEKCGGIVQAVLVVNVIKDCHGVDKLAIQKEKVFYIFQI